MSTQEIQAEILRLARAKICDHLSPRKVGAELAEIVRRSGRSSAHIRAMFACTCEDVLRGRA